MFSRLDTISACDGQTPHDDRDCAMRRAGKNEVINVRPRAAHVAMG